MKKQLLYSMGIVVAAVMVLSGFPVRAQDDPGADFESKLARGRQALSRWNYGEADRLSQELLVLSANPDLPAEAAGRARLFRASYFYYLGDYASTVAELDQLKGPADAGDGMPNLYERSQKLVEVWKGSKEATSEHFIVRYQPGKDEVLVEPALATLEKAYTALTADFKIAPDGPVLVEIYPSFEGFQAATNLKEEDLENSGTIAVCKYRRLMINTPRNLFYGYNYRDTLSHEFVHFLVYQKYAETVPIWLHEGLAKYQEDRWRKDRGGTLEPSQASLLASALRQNELISFDRMSPSFAYLKTPAQGQLAFAEVTYVVAYLIDLGGWDMIFRLCDQLSRDPDYRVGIMQVTGSPFDRFWLDWIAYVRRQDLKEIPGVEITALEIRKGDEGFDEVDEDVDESDLESGDEWRYVRLGDLLRDRQHYAAAIAEYERARAAAPYSPRVLNKIGLTRYLAGELQEGIEPLNQALAVYPGHVNTSINLGRIYFELGDKDEAERLFRQALDVNPFNPIPYGYLAKIYEERGDRDQLARIERDGRTILGLAPAPDLKDMDPADAPGETTEKGNINEHGTQPSQDP